MSRNPDLKKKPPFILIVDEDASRRGLLVRAMQNEEYGVFEASNGEEGLKRARECKPDLVLLDAELPILDGFKCCGQIQSMMGETAPAILMMIVGNDNAAIDRAFEAGATDFLSKPIHWTVLRQRVGRILASRWAIAQLQRQIQREHLLTEQLERANQQLQRLALIDRLTQIANRRYFDQHLSQQWNQLAREESSLSLIMCDIDWFKSYNDTYGHQAGDECLQTIANLLSDSVKRAGDLVARYGGEEFAIVLSHTNTKGALQLAESIRETLKERAIPHKNSPINDVVTLSLGVASMIPTPKSSANKLIAEADDALYQAKESGRDMTCLAQSTAT